MIEVSDIQFSYGRVRALDGISLSIGNGAVGLLGPNGAGKSTLIRILLGFLSPQRGEGRVLGYDIRRQQPEIRRAVGYMPEDDCLIEGLDAVRFTAYFGELSGMPRRETIKRAHDVLFYVGLGEARYRMIETYSVGMRQRLKLAQALVHDPKLLFLDEPTSNLDPQGRMEILELIRDLSTANQVQVLMSSHILPDIEAVCSGVVILHQGKVAAEGTIRSLSETYQRLYEAKLRGDLEALRKRLEARGWQLEMTEGFLTRISLPEEAEISELFRAAAETGVQVRHLVRQRTSLEDLFARSVGVD